MSRLSPALAARTAALAILLLFLFTPQVFTPLLKPLTHYDAPAIYTQNSLLMLALAHMATALAATSASMIIAGLLGIFVTRRAGAPFLPLARAMAYVGQSFPPVVVLALAVPAVGFGLAPTLIALFLYGLLPIFENTMTGLQTLPAATVEAARGMGMTPAQRLLKVELPLAASLILEGVRLSLVISIGTATIGSTVATPGLGEVIIAGLSADNNAYVLQGAVVVALMAMLTYDGLQRLERRLLRRGAALAA